ncbi:lysozyme [Henriciella sp.]|uniref:lysozyme n=1 Tax=Henriciella sp. TaxID=1968823 RepID=UPI00261B60F6|nr:lysozyme [Henriciella sp.]
MESGLRTSEAGLTLIRAYEGFRPHSSRLPDGRWVIGYGHVRAAREGLKVSQVEASTILREFDLPPIEQGLRDMVLVALNQNEFDALVSFIFNIGLEQFAGSDVLAFLNAGDRMSAARAIERWRNARVGPRTMVVDPLVRRRADEKSLFLKTKGSVPLASSSRFRPLPDAEPVAPLAGTQNFVVSEGGNISPEQTRPADQGDETAPEAAARTVKERLTRILGEQEPGDEDAPEGLGEANEASVEDGSQEASVEEIRTAISALVSDDDEADDEKIGKTGPGGIDFLQDEADENLNLRPGHLEVSEAGKTQHKDGLYIDDIDDGSASLRPGKEGKREGPLEIFVLSLIAMMGASLIAFGGIMNFGWLGIEMPVAGSVPSYTPLVLILVGGLIFVMMVYYLIKALVRSG